jgi:hypothetical protein
MEANAFICSIIERVWGQGNAMCHHLGGPTGDLAILTRGKRTIYYLSKYVDFGM